LQIGALEKRQEMLDASLRDKADASSVERHFQMACETKSGLAAVERRLDQVSAFLPEDVTRMAQHERLGCLRLSSLERQQEQLQVQLDSKVDHECLKKEHRQLNDLHNKEFVLRVDVIWWLESQAKRFREQIDALRTEFAAAPAANKGTLAEEVPVPDADHRPFSAHHTAAYVETVEKLRREAGVAGVLSPLPSVVPDTGGSGSAGNSRPHTARHNSKPTPPHVGTCGRSTPRALRHARRASPQIRG
jgi:hypothetical protein